MLFKNIHEQFMNSLMNVQSFLFTNIHELHVGLFMNVQEHWDWTNEFRK